MEVEYFLNLAIKTQTFDKYCEGYVIWLITQLKNLAKYRKCRGHLTEVAETIDEGVQSNNVGLNSP